MVSQERVGNVLIPYIIVILAVLAVILLPHLLIGLAIILLGFIEIIAPYKLFKWHEEWKPQAWREENLNPRQIAVFVWTIRIGGIFVIIGGVIGIIYVK